MKTLKNLTEEKFNEIYKNDSFLRDVVNSVECLDEKGVFKHFKTVSFPIEYIITRKQIILAKKEYEKRKIDKINSLGDKLVFVAMGTSYKAKYKDDVCNHRIRTSVVNPQGKRFFIELGTSTKDDSTRFDFVVNKDLENHYNKKLNEARNEIIKLGGFQKVSFDSEVYKRYQEYLKQPYYWDLREKWENWQIKYTKSNVIHIVNKLFECNFKEMEIDECFLNTNNFECVSPLI